MAGAMLNIIANYILIPKIGIVGAAITSLLTQFFTNVVIGFIFNKIKKNNELMCKALNFKIIINILKKIILNNQNI